MLNWLPAFLILFLQSATGYEMITSDRWSGDLGYSVIASARRAKRPDVVHVAQATGSLESAERKLESKPTSVFRASLSVPATLAYVSDPSRAGPAR